MIMRWGLENMTESLIVDYNAAIFVGVYSDEYYDSINKPGEEVGCLVGLDVG